MFVAPTRKGETLPKWADLLKNELWAVMLSQIREKLNTPTDNEQLFRLKRMGKSPHSNPVLRDLVLAWLLFWLSNNTSLHRGSRPIGSYGACKLDDESYHLVSVVSVG